MKTLIILPVWFRDNGFTSPIQFYDREIRDVLVPTAPAFKIILSSLDQEAQVNNVEFYPEEPMQVINIKLINFEDSKQKEIETKLLKAGWRRANGKT